MSQRCFWKASVNSTYDTKVVLGVCGSILLKTKCGINWIQFTPEANGNCVYVSVGLRTLLWLLWLSVHTGLVTQKVSALLQVYFQLIYIFLFILGTVSFWIPVYLNFLFDFSFTRHWWMQERQPCLSRKCKLY